MSDTEWDPAIYSDSLRLVRDEGDAPDAPGRWIPYTWREVAEQLGEQVAKLIAFKRMVIDLDRNHNGRHEGDADVGDPSGVSHGGRLHTGDLLGYGIGGRVRYVMPERARRHDPHAWVVES